jgi:serine protease Do
LEQGNFEQSAYLSAMPADISPLILQIATPFSTGTGFYLPAQNLVVTNEHVVRDNPTVLVVNEHVERQLLSVVYLDAFHELAFLQPVSKLALGQLTLSDTPPEVGDAVIAMGQIFGQHPQMAQGEIMEVAHEYEDIAFIQHTARLKSIQSGGPLFNAEGALIGVNMYDIDEGHQLSLSLPVAILLENIHAFRQGARPCATRCFYCKELVFEPSSGKTKFCPNCGKDIVLPCDLPEYQPTGVQATVEEIIRGANYDPRPARRGPNLWEIYQGSARILIAYHEDSGLVTGDAHLCHVPESHPAELFEYLLRQNYALEQLTFSTYGRDIILSLLIYDRYLNIETALPQFERLFERADFYDNYIIDKFGANWK